MTKVKDIINIIEEFAPLYLQEEFDNSGFAVGDRDMQVSGVLIALDINDEVIEEAIDNGINMIVIHHPVIFNPIKSVTTDTLQGELIIKAIKNDIAIYSAHTNVDNTDENIAREFINLLDTVDISPVAESCAIRATLKNEMTLNELVLKIKSLTEDSNIKYIGESDELVKEIVFANGANGSNYELLINSGVTSDVLITSELKYHIALSARQLGINVIECGHYESEREFNSLLKRKLTEGVEGVRIIISNKQSSPYNNIKE